MFAAARARRLPVCQVHGGATGGIGLSVSVATGQERVESPFELAECDPILWALGTRDRWLDIGEIHVQHTGVVAFAARGDAE